MCNYITPPSPPIQSISLARSSLYEIITELTTDCENHKTLHRTDKRNSFFAHTSWVSLTRACPRTKRLRKKSLFTRAPSLSLADGGECRLERRRTVSHVGTPHLREFEG